MNVKELLKPFKLKGLKIPSRVVMSPMTRNQCINNIPGEDVASYYRKRAENNVGLIITEGAIVEPKTGHALPGVPDFDGVKALDGWKNVVDTVHEAGGKIFPQLWHVGSTRQKGMLPYPEIPGYGPSAVVHPFSSEANEPPVEMNQADIDRIINAFGKAAGQAERIGFDGVEIHGAHGYLIDQFLWNVTNKRTDQYGGQSLPERMRFAVELLQSVRSNVSNNFPVCFRFSQWKMGDYKAKLVTTPEELEQFLIPLVKAGVDIFHCSTRRFYEPEFPGSDLNLAGWTKRLTGKPVITVGSVGLDIDMVSDLVGGNIASHSQSSVDKLIERLEKEEFDLVAIGRALLADYSWFTKVVDGRFNDVKIFTKELLGALD